MPVGEALPTVLSAAAVFVGVVGAWAFRGAARPRSARELLLGETPRAAARREQGALLRALLPPAPAVLREEADLERIAGQLLEAGSPGGLNADLFLRLKFAVAVIAGALALLVFFDSGPVAATLVAIAATAGAYRLPNVWLGGRIRARARELERALPNAVDALVLALEAGMDLEGALRRVAARQRGPLREALDDVIDELGAGVALGTALQRLAARTRSSELKELLALVQQSRRLGVGLAAGLRVRAQELRTNRRLRAQEAAQRAPLKILFPLVLFFLPALLLVFLSPAILTLVSGS